MSTSDRTGLAGSHNAFARAAHCLAAAEVDAKLSLTAELWSDWAGGVLHLGEHSAPQPIGAPGRPAQPRLVSPLAVQRRNVGTPTGRAALIHALAHIEFNAINLALDAVCRFRGMPRDYYDDWLRVAAEEAYHFRLLRDHLRGLGHDYGDFDAHDGLWEMAVKTAHDVLTRMALVPRVLEARGLDASPALIRKLAACGDTHAVEILEIIQRDEVGHVRIGNRWYAHLCAQRGVDPVATFRALLREFGASRVRPPFDMEARRAAGFDEQDMKVLEEFAAARER